MDRPKSPLALLISAALPSISQVMVATSPPVVDISVHLASSPPTRPMILVDSSFAATSLLSYTSMLPTTSFPLVAATIPIPTLTLLEAFLQHMQNVPSEISQIFLDPTIQTTLAQVLASALPSKALRGPLAMEATMLISEEWEK